MARPKTVYRGESRPGWIITLAVTVLVVLVLLAVWMFFDMQKYIVYEKDGVRLVLPSAGGAAQAGDTAGDAQELTFTPVDVEIVVEKNDYSGVAGTDGSGLSPLRGRFVSAENVTENMLNGYTYGIGDFNALVLELKPESGLLSWHSAVPLADSYGVNGTVELREYVEKLKENGVWMVAQLSCLADGTMAARNSPVALKNAATGGLFLDETGQAWLDPYNTAAREYLAALMWELAGMGFDEILLTGLYLPEGGELEFSGEMTATPDAESAVSSMALYLRTQADALGIRLTGMAERGTLQSAGEQTSGTGQNLAVFFKAFDRVAYSADYDSVGGVAVLTEAMGGTGDAGDRVVPVATGFVPEHESYVVK